MHGHVINIHLHNLGSNPLCHSRPKALCFSLYIADDKLRYTLWCEVQLCGFMQLFSLSASARNVWQSYDCLSVFILLWTVHKFLEHSVKLWLLYTHMGCLFLIAIFFPLQLLGRLRFCGPIIQFTVKQSIRTCTLKYYWKTFLCLVGVIL